MELVTGDVITQHAEVAGREGDYIPSRTAYAFDEASRSVVLLTADGDVLAIPLDGDRAGPAQPEVAARWRDGLNLPDERSAYDATYSGAQYITADDATLPDGSRRAPRLVHLT